MLNSLARQLKATRWFWIAALILASLFWHASPEAFAAKSVSSSTAKADIVIDGRPIFQIEPSGPYSAQQRAEQVNRQLALFANLGKAVEVKVVERNQLPTIEANEQYLLTVTELDAKLDKTPTEQAEEWATALELSLQQSNLERDPEQVRYMTWLAGFVLLLAIAAHISLGFFWRRSLKHTLRRVVPGIPKTGMPGSQDFHFFMNLKLTIVRLGIWAIAAWYISSIFPTLRQRRYDLFNNSTTGIRAPLFSLGGESYTIADILILLGLVWGLFALVQISAQLLSNQILRRTQLSRGAKEIVTQAYRYGTFTIGMLILLQTWGIDLRSIALLGSALGIGIGFGFQDIAKNFGSGLVLLVERSVQVGDFIEIGSHMGVVERIGARSIALRTLDNISILVPNAHLIDSQVVNWNHDHPVSRLHLKVCVDYKTDPKIVKSALLQTAQEHPEVLPKPSPDVYLREFGDSAIEFDLMVWIRDPERQLAIRSDLYFRIDESLRDRQISIPYPQRDLHLKTGQVPITFPPEITTALLAAFSSAGQASNGNGNGNGNAIKNTTGKKLS